MSASDAARPGGSGAPRILVSAYACEPGKGSEQGVGWNWALQIAEFADVEVITRANNRPVIEAAIPPGTHPRLRFHYHDAPASVRRLKRGARGLALYYWAWQRGAFALARRITRQRRFDAVMALTFGTIWMPTSMHRLGLPFVLGPVGGGEAVPRAMLPALPPKARALETLRGALVASAVANPALRARMRAARTILARTADTARLVPSRDAGKVVTVLETAMPEDVFDAFPEDLADRRAAVPGRMHAIYVGRLIGLKYVSGALRAVARARARGIEVTLDVVGDGPLRSALEHEARALGIAESLRFLGQISRQEIMERLGSADVFLFPSLKEGGAWAPMEAMAASLPVICMETSGMAEITDEACAVRVPPTSPDAAVSGMAEGIVRLAADPDLRRRMGRASRIRLEERFRWEDRGRVARAALLGPRAVEEARP